LLLKQVNVSVKMLTNFMLLQLPKPLHPVRMVLCNLSLLGCTKMRKFIRLQNILCKLNINITSLLYFLVSANKKYIWAVPIINSYLW